MRIYNPGAIALSVVSILCLCGSAQAFSSGAPSAFNGSPASGGLSCSVCHGSDTGPGSVQIQGLTTPLVPSTVYDLIIRVQDDDQIAAGFELSVEDDGGAAVGTLTIIDAINTQFASGDSDWATHTLDGVVNSAGTWAGLGNAAEYSVRWESPAVFPGGFTFFAAGNAVNGDGSSTGDRVYLTSIRVPEPASLVLIAMGAVMLRRRRR